MPSRRVTIRTVMLPPAIGFALFALCAYAFEMREFLTTPDFEGLYDMNTSEQNFRGWFRIHDSRSGVFLVAGFVGACAGAALCGAALILGDALNRDRSGAPGGPE